MCMENDEQLATTKELVEKLGLDGQGKFYAGESQGACPYRKMTKREAWVYGILLPKQTELKHYDDAPVPLRVLQIAAHAVELMPGQLYVWHPENADIKDPVLTLRVGPSLYNYQLYILARWGCELDNFETLAGKAKEIFRAKLVASLEKIQSDVQSMLGRVDSIVNSAAVEGKNDLPTFYA